MFGYVTVHKPEMKMKEYYKYKAYYCGLCSVLREKYGFLGQMTLTYDMTFLVVLLTSLYECKGRLKQQRCMAHPVQKQKMLTNEITEYAADMNLILTYFKLLDDWNDERSKKSLVGLRALQATYKELEKKYEKKCRVIRRCLRKLHECEEREEESLDTVSRYFGELMSELFVYKQDVWEHSLRRMGFYLGKFIYIVDAYDDLEDDIEKDNYNALMPLCVEEQFDQRCREMLNYILAECTAEFEKLPCIEDVEILRNILYAGVWEKFEKKVREKNYDEQSI